MAGKHRCWETEVLRWVWDCPKPSGLGEEGDRKSRLSGALSTHKVPGILSCSLSSLFLHEASETPSFRVYLAFPLWCSYLTRASTHSKYMGELNGCDSKASGPSLHRRCYHSFPPTLAKSSSRNLGFGHYWKAIEHFSVQAKLINTSFLELWLCEQNIALKVRPHHREVA